jgi:hypothetical protein
LQDAATAAAAGCASTGNATLLLLLLPLLSSAQPDCGMQVRLLPQAHGCMS